jgi:hypothetical protein
VSELGGRRSQVAPRPWLGRATALPLVIIATFAMAMTAFASVTLLMSGVAHGRASWIAFGAVGLSLWLVMAISTVRKARAARAAAAATPR